MCGFQVFERVEIFPSTHLSIHPFINPSTPPSICSFTHPSIHPPIYLSIHPPTLSIYFTDIYQISAKPWTYKASKDLALDINNSGRRKGYTSKQTTPKEPTHDCCEENETGCSLKKYSQPQSWELCFIWQKFLGFKPGSQHLKYSWENHSKEARGGARLNRSFATKGR